MLRPALLSIRLLACTRVQMGSGVPFRGAQLSQNLHTATYFKADVSCIFITSSSLSPGNSRPTSPKSDSELISKPSDLDNQNPAMHWAWGELPQAAKVQKCP